nr:immunoglobulin light chain junction region [Macaca mulatta]MOX33373.1 immunoglobulin light chain junction region [Macaca mulatta]MOX33610.1 immunoglobulin light chain junction region [Macaca mulatta]MOX33733.1 immunoglobulin light chain junction region [Macaca mulatta]MOX33740.1 immunoglobulin light chain junction region [Macaca mulatta]
DYYCSSYAGMNTFIF